MVFSCTLKGHLLEHSLTADNNGLLSVRFIVRHE